MANNFPKTMIEKWLADYWKKRLHGKPSIVITNTDACYKSLTYVEGLSQQLKKLFRKDVKDVVVTDKMHKTVRNLHSKLKTKLPITATSNVCYKIPCKSCDSAYIGQTQRHLGTRLDEHKRTIGIFKRKKQLGNAHTATTNAGPASDQRPRSRSPRTKSTSPTNASPNTNATALKHHHQECGHVFDFDKVSVLSTESERNLKERLVLEACHILKEENTVNYRSDTQQLKSAYLP